jgi:hypothetical protein
MQLYEMFKDYSIHMIHLFVTMKHVHKFSENEQNCSDPCLRVSVEMASISDQMAGFGSGIVANINLLY